MSQNELGYSLPQEKQRLNTAEKILQVLQYELKSRQNINFQPEHFIHWLKMWSKKYHVPKHFENALPVQIPKKQKSAMSLEELLSTIELPYFNEISFIQPSIYDFLEFSEQSYTQLAIYRCLDPIIDTFKLMDEANLNPENFKANMLTKFNIKPYQEDKNYKDMYFWCFETQNMSGEIDTTQNLIFCTHWQKIPYYPYHIKKQEFAGFQYVYTLSLLHMDHSSEKDKSIQQNVFLKFMSQVKSDPSYQIPDDLQTFQVKGGRYIQVLSSDELQKYTLSSFNRYVTQEQIIQWNFKGDLQKIEERITHIVSDIQDQDLTKHLSSIISKIPGLELELTEQQIEIINKAGTVVVDGPPGCGKTITAVLKMLAQDAVFRKKLAKDETIKSLWDKHKIPLKQQNKTIRQVYIANSAVAANGVRDYYLGLWKKIRENYSKGAEGPQIPEEFGYLDRKEITTVEKLLEKVPENLKQYILDMDLSTSDFEVLCQSKGRLGDLNQYEYPLFTNLRKFLFMLDGCLKYPFLERDEDGNPKGISLMEQFVGPNNSGSILKLPKKEFQIQKSDPEDEKQNKIDEDKKVIDNKPNKNKEVLFEGEEEESYFKVYNSLWERATASKVESKGWMREASFEDFLSFWKEQHSQNVNLASLSPKIVWNLIQGGVLSASPSYYIDHYKVEQFTQKILNIAHAWGLYKQSNKLFELIDLARHIEEQVNSLVDQDFLPHYIVLDTINDIPPSITRLLGALSQYGVAFIIKNEMQNPSLTNSFCEAKVDEKFLKDVGFGFVDLSWHTFKSVYNEPKSSRFTFEISQSLNYLHGAARKLGPPTSDAPFHYMRCLREGPSPCLINRRRRPKDTDLLLAKFSFAIEEDYCPDGLKNGFPIKRLLQQKNPILFGRKQAVIVRYQSEKAKVPKTLKHLPCLTVEEANGLEFEQVFLYNTICDGYNVTEQLKILGTKQQAEMNKVLFQQKYFQSYASNAYPSTDPSKSTPFCSTFLKDDGTLTFSPTKLCENQLGNLLDLEVIHDLKVFYSALSRSRKYVFIIEDNQDSLVCHGLEDSFVGKGLFSYIPNANNLPEKLFHQHDNAILDVASLSLHGIEEYLPANIIENRQKNQIYPPFPKLAKKLKIESLQKSELRYHGSISFRKYCNDVIASFNSEIVAQYSIQELALKYEEIGAFADAAYCWNQLKFTEKAQENFQKGLPETALENANISTDPTDIQNEIKFYLKQKLYPTAVKCAYQKLNPEAVISTIQKCEERFQKYYIAWYFAKALAKLTRGNEEMKLFSKVDECSIFSDKVEGIHHADEEVKLGEIPQSKNIDSSELKNSMAKCFYSSFKDHCDLISEKRLLESFELLVEEKYESRLVLAQDSLTYSNSLNLPQSNQTETRLPDKQLNQIVSIIQSHRKEISDALMAMNNKFIIENPLLVDFFEQKKKSFDGQLNEDEMDQGFFQNLIRYLCSHNLFRLAIQLCNEYRCFSEISGVIIQFALSMRNIIYSTSNLFLSHSAATSKANQEQKAQVVLANECFDSLLDCIDSKYFEAIENSKERDQIIRQLILLGFYKKAMVFMKPKEAYNFVKITQNHELQKLKYIKSNLRSLAEGQNELVFTHKIFNDIEPKKSSQKVKYLISCLEHIYQDLDKCLSSQESEFVIPEFDLNTQYFMLRREIQKIQKFEPDLIKLIEKRIMTQYPKLLEIKEDNSDTLLKTFDAISVTGLILLDLAKDSVKQSYDLSINNLISLTKIVKRIFNGLQSAFIDNKIQDIWVKGILAPFRVSLIEPQPFLSGIQNGMHCLVSKDSMLFDQIKGDKDSTVFDIEGRFLIARRKLVYDLIMLKMANTISDLLNKIRVENKNYGSFYEQLQQALGSQYIYEVLETMFDLNEVCDEKSFDTNAISNCRRDSAMLLKTQCSGVFNKKLLDLKGEVFREVLVKNLLRDLQTNHFQTMHSALNLLFSMGKLEEAYFVLDKDSKEYNNQIIKKELEALKYLEHRQFDGALANFMNFYNLGVFFTAFDLSFKVMVLTKMILPLAFIVNLQIFHSKQQTADIAIIKPEFDHVLDLLKVSDHKYCLDSISQNNQTDYIKDAIELSKTLLQSILQNKQQFDSTSPKIVRWICTILINMNMNESFKYFGKALYDMEVDFLLMPFPAQSDPFKKTINAAALMNSLKQDLFKVHQKSSQLFPSRIEKVALTISNKISVKERVVASLLPLNSFDHLVAKKLIAGRMILKAFKLWHSKYPQLFRKMHLYSQFDEKYFRQRLADLEPYYKNFVEDQQKLKKLDIDQGEMQFLKFQNVDHCICELDQLEAEIRDFETKQKSNLKQKITSAKLALNQKIAQLKQIDRVPPDFSTILQREYNVINTFQDYYAYEKLKEVIDKKLVLKQVIKVDQSCRSEGH